MKSTFTLLIILTISVDILAQPGAVPQEHWQKAEQFLSQQKDASGFFLLGAGGKIMMQKGLGFAD